jgi:hypothetical protein
MNAGGGEKGGMDIHSICLKAHILGFLCVRELQIKKRQADQLKTIRDNPMKMQQIIHEVRPPL